MTLVYRPKLSAWDIAHKWELPTAWVLHSTHLCSLSLQPVTDFHTLINW